jgi:hypothetical protein
VMMILPVASGVVIVGMREGGRPPTDLA